MDAYLEEPKAKSEAALFPSAWRSNENDCSQDKTDLKIAEKAAESEESLHSKTPHEPSLSNVQNRIISDGPPDGGARAWLVVLGAWCCGFCTFGWTNATGVFQDYYQTELFPSLPAATIAWIFSLENFFINAGGPVWGLLYDYYGPRWLLLTGTTLHVFGLMMASISSKYYQIVLAQGFCSPIGTSMILYPAILSISTWFSKRLGLALGLMSTGASIGGIVLPIVFEHLVSSVGFGWAMRMCSFVILALMVVANIAVVSRVPPHPRKFQFKEYITPFKSRTYVLLSCSLVLFLGIFLPLNYLIVQARHEGMPDNLAKNLVIILNAFSILGRTLPCYASDRVGCYNIMIIMCGFSTLMVWILWIPLHGSAAIIIFAAFYGTSTGTVVSLYPALVSKISMLQDNGVRTGTLYGLVSIATLVSYPIGGAITDAQDGSFIGLKIFCGACLTLGTLFLILARTSITGWKVYRNV